MVLLYFQIEVVSRLVRKHAMPKCAMYLFRAKCVFFLPFPFSGFCTTGSVCFACEERVIFVNDVAAQP